MKKKWKYSKLRFCINNAIFNIGFWLNCKKIYKNIRFKKNVNDFFVDEGFKMHQNKKNVSNKRFVGYMYKGDIFHDNPGMTIEDRETWVKWKKFM